MRRRGRNGWNCSRTPISPLRVTLGLVVFVALRCVGDVVSVACVTVVQQVTAVTGLAGLPLDAHTGGVEPARGRRDGQHVHVGQHRQGGASAPSTASTTAR